MNIGEDEVRRLAKMMRLTLSPAEVSAAKEAMNGILQMAERLKEGDDENGGEAVHIGVQAADGLRCREDETLPGIERDELLRAAPAAKDGLFAVPKVIE